MRNDLSRSRTLFEQDGTLIAVVELSLSSWVVAGIVPGMDRHPLKKLGADHDALLQLIERWRDEAIKPNPHSTPQPQTAFFTDDCLRRCSSLGYQS